MPTRDRLVRVAVLTGLVVLAAAARIAPHPPNLPPIAGPT